MRFNSLRVNLAGFAAAYYQYRGFEQPYRESDAAEEVTRNETCRYEERQSSAYGYAGQVKFHDEHSGYKQQKRPGRRFKHLPHLVPE
jgi:hypothetical protein